MTRTAASISARLRRGWRSASGRFGAVALFAAGALAAGTIVAGAAGIAPGRAAGQEPGGVPPGLIDDGAVIVAYHRFGESDQPTTNITLEQFEAHLKILAEGGYTVLPLPEIVSALAEGRDLPPLTVGISIDDAYLSVWTEAWPRLKAAGLPFTVFVATDTVDQETPRYMSWSQLRELAASPLVTIGSQTASHPHMPEQSAERNRQEIARSNARFERELGLRPRLFAYPFGEYGLETVELVKTAGFDAAFGQHSGAIGHASDLWRLPRFALNEAFGTPERFRLVTRTLPLPALDMTPDDPLLTPQSNPPAYGFTVPESVGPLGGLACYAGQGNEVRMDRLDRRIEVRFAAPFQPGRTRVNCTMPGPAGPEGGERWRWHGRQFLVPER